jgi:hypothetical protein
MNSPWETRELVLKLTSEYERWDALEKLKKLGWYPTDPKEKAYYYFAKSQLRDFFRNEKNAAQVLTTIVSNRSESKELRIEAAKTLGDEKIKSSTDALIKALDAEDGGVQNHAAIALGLIGDEKAVEPLVDRLRHGEDSDGIGGIRAFAATALARIGGDKAKSALNAALSSESKFNVRKNIKLGLTGQKIAENLEKLNVLPKAKIDKLRKKPEPERWSAFGGPKDLAQSLFDTLECYTRTQGVNLSPDKITLVIDNRVEWKGELAPATKQMKIKIVRGENEYYRFDY